MSDNTANNIGMRMEDFSQPPSKNSLEEVEEFLEIYNDDKFSEFFQGAMTKKFKEIFEEIK